MLLPLYPIIVLLALLRYLWAIVWNPNRAWIIAIGADQLLNAASNGNEDETISSRAARSKSTGARWACVLCKVLDIFERDHCDKSLGV